MYKEWGLVIPAHHILVATTIFGQGVEWKLYVIYHSGSESSTSFSLLGAKVPGDESSMERKSEGTKVPPMELSLPGAKVRGNESSSYRWYRLAVLITKKKKCSSSSTLWPQSQECKILAGNLYDRRCKPVAIYVSPRTPSKSIRHIRPKFSRIRNTHILKEQSRARPPPPAQLLDERRGGTL